MTRFVFGDLIIVDFPFSDLSGSKRRPAFVLAHDGEDDVLLARITSKSRETALDVVMHDWKVSKLLFPSTICIGKLATLSRTLVEGKMGEATVSDKKNVILAFRNFVDLLPS